MINLEHVLTFSEAAEKWGLADGNTIRKAVERHKFEDHEIRKSGNVWLTTYEAMTRVFGMPQDTTNIISYHEIAEMAGSVFLKHQNKQEALQLLYQNTLQSVRKGEPVTVIESNDHPERIILILKTEQDLHTFMKRMERYLNTMYSTK